MIDKCDHGTPLGEDCGKCRAIIDQQKQARTDGRVWVWYDEHEFMHASFTKPIHAAVEYMRVLSRAEVDKLASYEGVDTLQLINSLHRTIDGQRKHIARLTAQHGPTCICAACEDKRGRMTL
jgi:hypothetical protein